MSVSSRIWVSFILLFELSLVSGSLVPALYIFGDSIVDVGNNNHLFTIIKANFPPYGRDFPNQKPTGRFCNGRLSVDFIAEILGFDSYQVPYPGGKFRSEEDVLIGANFASGASGFSDKTAMAYNTISLTQQLRNFEKYKKRLERLAGENASSILTRAIYIVTTGSSDFLQYYYINPLVRAAYSTDRFSDMLLHSYASFIHRLYELGARRIGVTSLPPLGCLPAAITLFNWFGQGCVTKLNDVAVSFNDKLNATSELLLGGLPDLKLVVFDIYQSLHDLVTNPSNNGFFEARKACCGTGLVESSILCNRKSVGTCSNASAYVFWDAFHPTDAANEAIVYDILADGISLIV